MNNQKEINIELREEQPGDYHETEMMTREAFWNHFVPGCDEHYLLHVMRKSPAFVPHLNTVAVREGRIIGNAAYAKTTVVGDDGRSYEVLSLGPIAVLPKYQGRGVGGKLIAYTKAMAREMGYRAIFLFGDPDYYSRQGFVPAECFGIRTEDDMYAAAHQVCLLQENGLMGIAGRYVEGDAYKVDETAAAAFDAAFPPKEKISGTPSQMKFKKIVAMRRKAL